jgi:hypothetical protein
MSEIDDFLAARDALFHDMTLERATAFWQRQGLPPPPVAPDVPLASAHKARLQWLDATDAMLEESIAWLKKHDYSPAMLGAPPLTPARRDAEREALGKPPL